jgi:hypothetical protein
MTPEEIAEAADNDFDYPIEDRWAWPDDWRGPGHIYWVMDCPRVYFRCGYNGRVNDSVAYIVCLDTDTGDRRVWRNTGQLHPTQNAVLAVWPD